MGTIFLLFRSVRSVGLFVFFLLGIRLYYSKVSPVSFGRWAINNEQDAKAKSIIFTAIDVILYNIRIISIIKEVT